MCPAYCCVTISILNLLRCRVPPQVDSTPRTLHLCVGWLTLCSNLFCFVFTSQSPKQEVTQLLLDERVEDRDKYAAARRNDTTGNLCQNHVNNGCYEMLFCEKLFTEANSPGHLFKIDSDLRTFFCVGCLATVRPITTTMYLQTRSIEALKYISCRSCLRCDFTITVP